MDRFAWTDIVLAPDEQMVTQQGGIRLYDGDEKVFFYTLLSIMSRSEVWSSYVTSTHI